MEKPAASKTAPYISSGYGGPDVSTGPSSMRVFATASWRIDLFISLGHQKRRSIKYFLSQVR